MDEGRVRQIVRQLPENGLKQVLSSPANVRGTERLRRLELLSYVEGLVYHSRGHNEHQALRARIDDALRDDEARLGVEMVRKTLADVHRDQVTETVTRDVTLAERKRTLLRLLR